VRVIGIDFVGRNKEGDFNYMIKRKEYEDSLFIFNDNEQDHTSTIPGGGNAIIRPFNRYSGLAVPRSAGIPTGRAGGYPSLTSSSKDVIDSAMDEIRDLIRIHGFRRVFYSADENGKLGTSIFVVGEDIRDYITDQIRDLENL
jgi:hypothetical protein